MDKKVLTVSIAAYNVGQFIGQTLESLVLKKNMEYMEVLIINDGSSDNTSDQARQYIEKFPDTFRLINKANGGHGSTINVGLENARGKYFKVLDGDDWVSTEAMEQLLGKLEVSDVDLVLTNRINVYERNKVEVREFQEFCPGKIYPVSKLNISVNVSLSSICIKTEIFRKSGLKCSENCFYEDIEYDIYALYISSNFMYIDLFVYMYRLGHEGQSVSWSSRRKNIHMLNRISKTVNDFYVQKCGQLSDGHKESIINRISMITYSTFVVYLSFNPTEEIKKQILTFLQDINVKEIKKQIMKDHKVYKIIDTFPFSYWVIAHIYRRLKGIKN